MSRLREELQEFVLENVEIFDEERVLGTGSYGSVQEVMINGEVYAAKMIHEALLETDERGGVATIATKYLRECRLMSHMRHPNITQFVGICFKAGSRLPLLVMERLDCSLDELVETIPTLPLSVSVYMLMGVCRGLLYLHHESVVHRDLTARNVLLTTTLRAKITDFGNSRIVRLEPGRLARTLTRFPGTLVYMAPEAVSDDGQYGPSLDVFSFGVLMLFVLTQVFPGDLLSPTYPDPNNPDRLLGRSEFERRSVYTSHLKKKLDLMGGREHRLVGMVRECLANTPERRPATSDLLSSLEEVGTETEDGLLLHDITRVKTVRSLRAKMRRIQELQREVTEQHSLLTQKDGLLAQFARQQEAFRTDLSARDDIIARKDQELGNKETQLAQKDRLLAQKNGAISQKDGLLAHKDTLIADKEAIIVTERERALAEREALIQAHREQIEVKEAAHIQQVEEMVLSRDHMVRDISQKDKLLAQKDTLIADKEATIVTERERAFAEREALIQAHREQIEVKDAELARRAAHIQQMQEMVQSRDHVIRGASAPVRIGAVRLDDPPQMLRSPLSLKWRRGKDMPTKMGITVQSVVVGDFVYIGGGDAGKVRDICTVMKLNIQPEKWTKLPQYSAMYFAMTSFANQLVLVGGRDPVTEKPTNQIAVLASGRWTNPYPPMNTARYTSTAVCYNNYIIVAGGHDRSKRTTSVEVLDTTSRKWYIAESLPNPRSQLKSILIGNTLYLMGGRGPTGPTKLVHKVGLNELVTKAISKQATPTLWQSMEDTLFNFSAPLNVGGYLFTVGGRDDHYNPSSSIHLYQPDTRRWVKVGDLPTARYNCTCSVLPSGEVTVAGGHNGILSISTVDFLSISNAH